MKVKRHIQTFFFGGGDKPISFTPEVFASYPIAQILTINVYLWTIQEEKIRLMRCSWYVSLSKTEYIAVNQVKSAWAVIWRAEHCG